MVQRDSRSSTIGHITLGMKQTGAPSAGNPHAGCDVAGAGNGFTVWLLRHSQRKRGAMVRLDLRNTAPVLDPTASLPRYGTSELPELSRLAVTNPSCCLTGIWQIEQYLAARAISFCRTRRQWISFSSRR